MPKLTDRFASRDSDIAGCVIVLVPSNVLQESFNGAIAIGRTAFALRLKHVKFDRWMKLEKFRPNTRHLTKYRISRL